MTDLLYGFFFVFSFLSYLKYRTGGSRWTLWVALGLFAFAMLSKEPAIGMVLLVFVYELIRPAEKASPGRLSDGGAGDLLGRVAVAGRLGVPFRGLGMC